MTAAWPATLRAGPVALRPLRAGDARAWGEVRRANEEWLRPWEATVPGQSLPDPTVRSYLGMLWRLRHHARLGRLLPFAMTVDDRLAGQLTVGGITLRRVRSAYVGYWIDHRLAGHGYTPTAVALAVDHCFATLGLDRMEANVRPENAASRRVVEKLGFRQEQLRPRYLYIDGNWRDHLCYVVVPADIPDGMLAAWQQHASR